MADAKGAQGAAKAEEAVQSVQADEEADLEAVRGSVVMRAGKSGATVLVVIALLLGIGVIIWAVWSGGSTSVGALVPGETASGAIGPDSPVSVAGKPFDDYTMHIKSMGTYRIDLVTEKAESYDPFLAVIRDGNTVASDNDAGEGVNARVVHEFRPGQYTVRVTSYKASVPSAAVKYHVSATRLSD